MTKHEEEIINLKKELNEANANGRYVSKELTKMIIDRNDYHSKYLRVLEELHEYQRLEDATCGACGCKGFVFTCGYCRMN